MHVIHLFLSAKRSGNS